MGYEEGGSVNEISTGPKLLSSSGLEWWNNVQLPVVSLDLKQAFDKVLPQFLGKAMKDFWMHPTLATAMLREQLGGKNDISFQETRTAVIGCDTSNSPAMFNM